MKRTITGVEFHLDIGPSSNIFSIKRKSLQHNKQKPDHVQQRKQTTLQFFDNVDVRQYFVENDGNRYPKIQLILNKLQMINSINLETFIFLQTVCRRTNIKSLLNLS